MLYKDALFASRVAFRKAAIYETFISLGMDKLLAIPHFEYEVAMKLNLNGDAISRFLYALASLGLVAQKESGEFYTCKDIPIFTEESSLILLKLINNKILDILDSAPKNFEEILAKTNMPVDELQFLDQAVKYKLLDKQANYYKLPLETRNLLISNSSEYIGPMIEYLEKIAMPTFTSEFLIAGLQSGQSQWQKYLGDKATHPFDLYKKYPELLETFTFGMHKLNENDNNQVVQNLSSILEDVNTVLDIGGGSGCLALALKKYSKINTIDIYELPDAIATLKTVFNKYANNKDGINYIAGSFLESLSSGGLQGLNSDNKYNMATLSWILHDWNDKTALEILKKLYYHVENKGKIIILESVLPESRIGSATIGDLTMLLHTEGRERTFEEYKKLLENVGFTGVTLMSNNTNRQAIIGYKQI
jgi:ubiquinone/menaquinone biosynthesis C-methylase UbiE